MTKFLSIGDKIIGDNQPTFIIAEIGLNHNGSIKLAKKLIQEAKEAGADAVKFQKRDLKSLYKKDIFKDPNKDSQSTAYLVDIFKKYELSEDEFIKLKKFCDNLNIIFFATPFDIKSAKFLEKIDVPLYKISSSDLTNIPLIKLIVNNKKPMILSTGMSQMEEIDFTVNFLNKKHAQYALLHCVSAYPVPFKDVNLRMISVLKKRYQVPVGWSGHERGIIVSICSIALGGSIVERHITLNRGFNGPDHNISLTPRGFYKMVERIRAIELALGHGKKFMSRGEVLSREVFVKSLIARKNIKKGTVITYELIDIKAPGKGLNPQMIDQLIGRKAVRDIKQYDYFTLVDIQ